MNLGDFISHRDHTHPLTVKRGVDEGKPSAGAPTTDAQRALVAVPSSLAPLVLGRRPRHTS
jgi:hypothetical protein